MQDMAMEAVSPRKESVPYSLYRSSRSPEAAEEENIFTIASGTSSPGNPIYEVNFPRISERKSRNPEARRIPTAVIRPIRVGRIRITVRNPLLAPFTNVSYTGTFIRRPWHIIRKNILNRC